MLRSKIVLILPLLVAATSGQVNRGIGYYGSSNVRDQRPPYPQPLYGRRPLPLPGRPMPLPRATPSPAVGSAAPIVSTVAPPAPSTIPPLSATAEPAPAPIAAPVVASPPAIPAAPSYAPVLRPNPGLRPSLYTPGYRPLLPSHPRPVRLSTPAPQPTQPVPVREPEALPEPATVSDHTPEPEPIVPSVVADREPLPSAPEPEPKPLIQAIQEPKLEPTPAPNLDPTSEPALEPVPELAPESTPESEPESVPEPAAELAPDSELEPVPEFTPEPLPELTPGPVPEPTTEPAPESVPEPAIEPAIESAPEPAPEYAPDYSKEPAPVLLPPAPAPAKVPVPVAPVDRSAAIPPTNKPGALPPLLPKRKPVREPVFGRQSVPSTPATIYEPTPSSPATHAPPVVITTHSYPVVTKITGTVTNAFQCKGVNGYYPVEHECDTYIECKHDQAIKYSCPDGLHFNRDAKYFEYPCAYPSEVTCLKGAIEQSPRSTDKCPNQYGFYSMNDGDCSMFIMCQEGLATIMDCPMGLVFNPQTSSCDWPANVPQCNPSVFKDFTCPEAPQGEDGQESDIILKYRYGKQCKQYVACQHGHPRLLSCERGLSFDESSQSCINEDFVTDCTISYSSLP